MFNNNFRALDKQFIRGVDEKMYKSNDQIWRVDNHLDIYNRKLQVIYVRHYNKCANNKLVSFERNKNFKELIGITSCYGCYDPERFIKKDFDFNILKNSFDGFNLQIYDFLEWE